MHCPKHVEFQAKNKSAKLVHLVGVIIKKFVTMHGHMNGKKRYLLSNHYFINTIPKYNTFQPLKNVPVRPLKMML